MLITAAPPQWVLLISNPAFYNYVSDNTNTTVILNLGTDTDTELTYTTPRMHREGQSREEEESFHGHLGQLQPGLACPRDPPP